MARKVELVTGDDINVIHPVARDFKMLNIPVNSTIACRIVSLDKSTAYTSEVTQLSTQLGANWTKGLISVMMSSAETAAIATLNPPWIRGQLAAWVESQVVIDGAKDTFFSKILIVRGNVT